MYFYAHRISSNKSDISYLQPQLGLEHSDPLKSSPGSHSQLVSFSVGIMSSCSHFWHFCSQSALCRCVYIASAPWYSVSQTCNSARPLIVATTVLKAAVKLTKVKLHGTCNNVCDVIIAHVISGDAQINRPTWKT